MAQYYLYDAKYLVFFFFLLLILTFSIQSSILVDSHQMNTHHAIYTIDNRFFDRSTLRLIDFSMQCLVCLRSAADELCI